MPIRKAFYKNRTFNQRVGERVLELILQRGYKSAYDFWIQSAGEDISRASLNYLVAGKGDPKLSTLRKVAERLDVSLVEFFDFKTP